MANIFRRTLTRAHRAFMAGPYRLMTDGPYRRVLPFLKAGGDDLLYSAPLPTNAVVVDAGAYTGGFGERIARTWGARVWAFEPVAPFREEAERRLRYLDAKVLPYGLSSENAQAKLTLDGDASSAFTSGGGKVVPVEFRRASEAFADLGLDHIDLLAINIEGAEYDLLDHLIKTGWHKNCVQILVQFHPFIPYYRYRYYKISRLLSKTHRREWRFPWVWEFWRRID